MVAEDLDAIGIQSSAYTGNEVFCRLVAAMNEVRKFNTNFYDNLNDCPERAIDLELSVPQPLSPVVADGPYFGGLGWSWPAGKHTLAFVYLVGWCHAGM